MKLKLTLLSLPLALLFAACQSNDAAETTAEVTIGMELEERPAVPFAVVDASPSDYYKKTVLVEATVTAVCVRKGCWMQVEDQGKTAMVRWEEGCDGAYKFPQDIIGKRIQIQGSFYPKTISPEDAEHIQGEAASEVKIPLEGYEFNASAVRYSGASK